MSAGKTAVMSSGKSTWLLLCSALLVLSFVVLAAFPWGSHLKAVLILITACYTILFFLSDSLPRPAESSTPANTVFAAVFAVLIFAILGPLTVSGPNRGWVMFGLAPISHVLLVDAAAFMPRRSAIFKSPLFLAGLVLASSPIWAVQILSAAHRLDGENAMGVLLYWFFYAPLGLYIVALETLRYSRTSAKTA